MKYIGFTLIALVFLFIVGWTSYSYIAVRQQEARSAAVDGCFTIARFVYEDGKTNTNSLMVIKEIYQECLGLKNIEAGLTESATN